MLLATSSRLAACAALLAAFAFAPRADAAPPRNLYTDPSVDLRGFSAPTDPRAGLYTEPASSPATGAWNVGLWASYASRGVSDPSHDLGSAYGSRGAYPVRNQLSFDAVANIGIAERLALGLDLPFALYQNGDAAPGAGSSDLPAQALGDLGVIAKVTLVKPTGGDLGGFALALHERFTLPTGSESSYLGEGFITSETRLLAEYRLLGIGLHATSGFKYRQAETFTYVVSNGDGVDTPSETTFGSELPFGVGLSFKPQAFGVDPEGRLTGFIEWHGALPLFPVHPFESKLPSRSALALSARYQLGSDLSLLAGIEARLGYGIANAPFRAVLSIGWAPRNHDVDNDGVPDDVDQCRELPEDTDGFQDDDGCPEGDNDDDGVPDEEDACPNQAGPESDDPKTNGCPI